MGSKTHCTLFSIVILLALVTGCSGYRHRSIRNSRRRIHNFGGHVAIANRNAGTISLVNPRTLETAASFTLPDNGEPMYFAYDIFRSFLWVGDRANSRIVVMKLRGNRIKLLPPGKKRFLPLAEGTFHTMPTQVNVDGSDSVESMRRPITCTTNDIDDVTIIHDVRSRKKLATIPLPEDIKRLGGKPHDTTNNGRYGVVTYIENSDGNGYVATYECGFPNCLKRRRGWRLVKLLKTAQDPHVAVRDDTNMVIAAQGGEVLFVTLPDMRVLSRDEQPSPHGVIISYNSKYLYVTNIAGMGKDAIVTYDMQAGKRADCDIVDTTNPTPHNPAVSLDGKRLFITHSGPESSVNSAFDIDQNGCPIAGSEKVFTTGLNPFGLTVIPEPRSRRGRSRW